MPERCPKCGAPLEDHSALDKADCRIAELGHMLALAEDCVRTRDAEFNHFLTKYNALKSERDAALAQVGVLRGVIDDFYNYEGGSIDPREDDYLMERAVDALTDTSATAQRVKAKIEREAIERYRMEHPNG